MILAIECAVACIVFSIGIIISIFVNRTFWLHEYPPAIRERYLDCHPDYHEKQKKNGGKGLLIARVIVIMCFLIVLTVLVYWAGARTLIEGALYSYIIWFTVNLFDVIILDLGILMYWKRIRLPGTEDMDEVYTANKRQHIKEGFIGLIMGLPVCLIVGLLIQLQWH